MSVDSISGSQSTSAENPLTTSAPPALGKEVFLQLLVTQLQHQDPLDPQDNSEFLAQLAQFSSLESLQTISDDTTALRGLFENGLTTLANETSGTSSSTGGA